ncbi:MAG TPA: hypothetical protein VN181_07720, partial [Thermoanaerobaculia bacterium]|nr:hypothetical protein [Thermoanaerobaculia bacterium]
VVNGGGALTFKFEKNNYVSAQRLVTSLWNQQKRITDVVLVRYDADVSTIALGSPNTQLARGSASSDADGSRRATLIVPSGTAAVLTFADGSTRSMASLKVRATELTVGATGPKAMPAALPATSGYTYCVEWSADEAVAEGASDVRFSKPLAFYLENFLAFPVGTVVPSGYYDRTIGTWRSSENGRVVTIVSVVGGAAQIDSNGDGAADTALGIDAAELQQLAAVYATGQQLWRVPIVHFTPWDLNFPVTVPIDAIPPMQEQPERSPAPERGVAACGWSVVDCVNQTLSESIAIQGTPFALEYNSGRASRTRYSMKIPLSGTTVPASLRRIDLTIEIAGQTIERSFTPTPNIKYDFTWNGLDAYGRSVQGERTGTISIGYAYRADYTQPSDTVRAWAEAGTIPIRSARDATEVILTQVEGVRLGQLQTGPNTGFGGWTFSAQRFYDGRGRVIYDDGGTQRSSDPQQINELGISTIAGTGECCNDGDGGPATAAKLNFVAFTATAPDGTIYLSEFSRIKKIDRNGVITTIAGTGRGGFTADGSPALNNRIDAWDIAVAPDGLLYMNDRFNHRVRKLVNGAWVTVAGNGGIVTSILPFKGVAATSVPLNPTNIAIAPDGTLYIAEPARISRVDADGIMTTIAGNGTSNSQNAPEGGLAKATAVGPEDVAVGPDGSIYFTDSKLVARIRPDGRLVHAAGSRGSSNGPFVADGQSATSGPLKGATRSLAVAPDGTLLLGETGSIYRMRSVAPSGGITTFAGNGQPIFPLQPPQPNVTLARGSKMTFTYGIEAAPDGSVIFPDYNYNIVRRIDSTFPAMRAGKVAVASGDGSEVYFFENSRHVRTVDSLTRATLYSLEYDANGNLTLVRDGIGNVTTIERDTHGEPKAIIAPGGQQTTLVVTGGKLTSIANAAAESHLFSYSADGLLSRLIDPRGGVHKFMYDENGLLTKDEDPAGGFISLMRSGGGGNYRVTRTSAEGRQQSYQLALREDLTDRRSYAGLDGLSSVSTSAGGTNTLITPDGTTLTVVTTGDPRFGTQAPTVASATLTTPSGARLTLTHSRTITLTNSLDPLAVDTVTDIDSINGHEFRTVFDARTRTLTRTSAMGRTFTATLDAQGRLSSVSSPGLASSSYFYDVNGHLREIASGNRLYGFDYNARHELIRIIDPLQRSMGLTHNAAGRVSSLSLPGDRLVSFDTDPHGNLTAVSPPGRAPHQFQYTPVDLQNRYEPPNVAGGGATISTFDHDRHLTSVLRPDGRVIDIEYDTAARPARATTSAGTYRYAYDQATGNLSSITSPDASTL